MNCWNVTQIRHHISFMTLLSGQSKHRRSMWISLFLFFCCFFFFFYFITKIALRYSWFILLYWLQVYNILIQYCYRLFSIYVTIKCWLYSLCYTTYPHSLFLLNSSLYLLIFYPMPLTPSLSPLATTDLFSISVSLFLFCYIQLFVF